LEDLEEEFVMPYNHIFIPEGRDKPVEFFYNEFARDSHRSRATKKFNEFLGY